MTEKKPYFEYAPTFLEKLPGGAFLTVAAGEKVNTMTIGWGSMGFFWQKPVMIIAVRYSRYTYELLEQAREFTISVPLQKDLKKALVFAGSKSGRDHDKFEACSLTLQKARVVKSPVISECDLFVECKVLYQQAMEPGMLDSDLKERFYQGHDYHVFYYGEIVALYQK